MITGNNAGPDHSGEKSKRRTMLEHKIEEYSKSAINADSYEKFSILKEEVLDLNNEFSKEFDYPFLKYELKFFGMLVNSQNIEDSKLLERMQKGVQFCLNEPDGPKKDKGIQLLCDLCDLDKNRANGVLEEINV